MRDHAIEARSHPILSLANDLCGRAQLCRLPLQLRDGFFLCSQGFAQVVFLRLFRGGCLAAKRDEKIALHFPRRFNLFC